MNPNLKRILSFFLAVVMCVSALPVSVLATEAQMPEAPAAAPEAEIPEPAEEIPEGEDAVLPDSEVPAESGEDVTDTEGIGDAGVSDGSGEELPGQDPSGEEPSAEAEQYTLTLHQLPEKTWYQLGEEIDLTGLELLLHTSDGETLSVFPEDGITVVSGDTDSAGRITITLDYEGLTVDYEILVHTTYVRGEILQDSDGYPESRHDYANNSNELFTYTCENAEYLKLVFSPDTLLESGWDKLYLYDAADTEIGVYSGSALAGVTVQIPGDTVKLKLTSDSSVTRYGFSLDAIYAYLNLAEHEPADEGVYTDYGCFTDSYTTHNCWICGETFVEVDEGTASHRYAEGFCSVCGIPENAVSAGSLSNTVLWAVTEDNVLYVSGTGEIPDRPNWSGALGAATDVVVGQGITKIGTYAFENASGLRTILLPEGLEVIGDYAFYNCYNITEIDIPDTVTTIGSCAFYNCDGLTRLYIPAGVETISGGSYSYSPFYNCTSALVLYCGAETKPEGWGNYWNFRSSGSALPTSFGFTREDYRFWLSVDTGVETFEIPEGITAIPDRAFYNCSGITEVIIPDSVKYIGNYAFYGCTGLLDLALPASLIRIGDYALSNCSGLTDLVIPGGVKEIGSYAFYNCYNLPELILPAGLERIGDYAFQNCYGLTELVLPETLTDLGNGILYNVTGVTALRIPASVTNYGSAGFLTGSSVTEITFADGISRIPANVLRGANRLQTVSVPDTVTEVGEGAFYNCSALTEIRLPASVKVIGSYAFYNCNNLTEVILPAGLEIIGEYAFYYCKNAAGMVLPETLKQIGNYAFYNCLKLTAVEIPAGVTVLSPYAFSNCVNLASVTVPQGVTEIGAYAFQNCSALTEVMLPEGLTTLGNSIFYGCPNIVEIRLPASLTDVHNNGYRGPLDGSGVRKVIFADGITELPAYILANNVSGTTGTYASKIQEVVFEAPEKISVMGDYAFYNCGNLVSVDLPDGILFLSNYAFYNCGSLKEADLPDSMTSFGSSVFYGCVALEAVEIPEQITALPASIFQNCSRLARVTFHGGITEIGENAFSGCTALTEVVLPEKLMILGCRAFYGCSGLTEIRLPASLTYMNHSGAKGALDGSGIRKVIFADGFTHIPDYALSSYQNSGSYASKIQEIVFEAPEKITSIGSNAFNNCIGLESFELPENVTAIPNYAFYYCTGLKEIRIPEQIASVGTYAFYNCINLEEIYIPAGQQVGSYAYANCTGARSLTIGDGAAIGSYAFRNDNHLENIQMGENVIMEQRAFYGMTIAGSCGDDAAYNLDIESGLLTISGSGAMYDYSPEEPAPWRGYVTLIRDLEIGDQITDIGNYAFYGCRNLEAVVLNQGVETVGEGSFAGCDDVAYVEIPDGVSYIGDDAFADCPSLETAAFLGDAPVLEDNVFGNSNVKVYYPELGTGYTVRLMNKFMEYIWSLWDNTVTSKDIVLLLDVSGSMYGKTDTLSSASTQLIKSIGGALKKSNIAVVEYDDSTRTLCDFTTNTYRLVRSVANLYDQGGTEYATALTRARNLLRGSDKDMQFVIMFSDGEPNDNKQNIYNLAAEMREEGIIIYTVGLGAYSSQRQVLVNVAGSETRYFEATNIADLVAAFEELSRNFGKSEFATVEMKVNDKRVDLFKEKYTLCLAANPTLSFYVTLGTNEMYQSVASYALEQNGRYVAGCTDGNFSGLEAAKCFTAGSPVYLVLRDAGGNVVERKELGLTFINSYTIRYLMGPDMDNKVYRSDSFVPGSAITPPKAPTRIGYNFAGWYSSENCEGIDFFTAQNNIGGWNLDSHITLYAKWNKQDTELRLGEETWTFSNSNSNFSCTHYEMTVNDEKQLKKTATKTEKSWIHDIRFPTKYDEATQKRVNYWGGSCFGMSSAVLLSHFGDLSIYQFPANGTGGTRYTTIGDARLILNRNGDSDVGAIESMINFYQVRQHFGSINTVRTNYDKHDAATDSENLKRIIRKMKDADAPVMVTITLVKSAKEYGGHAVVAYDLEEYANRYTFKIYDCSKFGSANNPIYHTVDVTVNSDGTYSASCDAWERAWSNYQYIFFKTALTVQELKALQILVAPNALSGVDSSAGNAREYMLTTSYGDFTITDGTSSAVVEDGQQVSGDLNITCYGMDSDVEEVCEYRFDLPVLQTGETYTITQSSSTGNITAVLYRHTQDGFYATHSAWEAGTVMIGADGSICSQYTGAVEQELKLSRNDMTTPWYTVQIDGASTGFALTSNGDSVSVVSAEETNVDITTRSDFNEVTLPDVSVSSEEVKIQESEDNCVAVQDNRIIAGAVYGYSVAFNSQMGTSVDTLTNVPYGSLIEEPTDPTKTGSIFEGWFVDEEYSRLWDFENDVVTQDTVLYAGWSVNPNYLKTVTFRVPGQVDQVYYIPKGEQIPESYAPVDENGEAMNWYTRADFANVPWDFEYDLVTENTVLYGKTALCTVSYEPNNGESLESGRFYAGNLVAEPAVVREGWTLCGWYTDAEFTQPWAFETDRIRDDMTLYAKWVENIRDKDGNDTGISVEIVNEADVTYTGKSLMPEIIVRDGGRVLTLKTDYTVTYKNNITACEKDDPNVKAAKLPQIVVQGKGNYKSSGKITLYFTIQKAQMADMVITVPTVMTVKSGGKPQTVKPVVSTDLINVNAKEYTAHYYTDSALTQEVSGITETGVYYLVLEAKGINLEGVSQAIRIQAVAADKMLSKAKITTPKNIYATAAQVDEATAIRSLIEKVVLNKAAWLTAEDNLETFLTLFTVSAVDADGTLVPQADLGRILNTVGKKSVIVTARDDNAEGLAGETVAKITVKGTPLNKKQFVVTFGEETGKVLLKTAYSGGVQVPNVYTELVEDVDYRITYLSGKAEVPAYQICNTGSYTLMITGMGSYSGSLNYKFSVEAVNLAEIWKAGKLRIESSGSAVYSPSGAVLNPVVSFSGIHQLTEGVDYTLKCSGNTKVTDKATATLTGKGNFKGSLSKIPELTFAVEPKLLSDAGVSVTITGITFKKDVVSKVNFTLVDSGKNVAAKEYTSAFTDDGENITLEITATEQNYIGSRTVSVSRNLIKATDKKQVITSLPEGNKYYYTGDRITPAIAITDKDGNDISQGFTVAYGANQYVGSGSITLTGRPDMGYCGTVTVKFTILPKWMKWIFG